MPSPKPLTLKMDKLPISEEALIAAAKAACDFDVALCGNFSDVSFKDEHPDTQMEYGAQAELVIRAFLRADGFEVERTEIHEPYASYEDGVASYRARCHRCDWTGPLRSGDVRNVNKNRAREDAEPHRAYAFRLVSRWKLGQGTDSPSSEGSDAAAAANDLGFETAQPNLVAQCLGSPTDAEAHAAGDALRCALTASAQQPVVAAPDEIARVTIEGFLHARRAGTKPPPSGTARSDLQ